MCTQTNDEEELGLCLAKYSNCAACLFMSRVPCQSQELDKSPISSHSQSIMPMIGSDSEYWRLKLLSLYLRLTMET